MANEKELVLRGVLAKPVSGIEGTRFVQYERHTHLDDGMITNRCRMESYRNENIYTTATKYTFSKTGNSKTAYEVQQSIDPEAFEVIANLCNEQIIKTRYELRCPEFVLELDVFRDMVNGQLSDGFKIDIEGDYEPSQEEIDKLLAEYDIEVSEWLEPEAWGERFNHIVRLYKDRPPLANGNEDVADDAGAELSAQDSGTSEQTGLEGNEPTQDEPKPDTHVDIGMEELDLIAPLRTQHLGAPDTSDPVTEAMGVENTPEPTTGLEDITPTEDDVRTSKGRILRGTLVYTPEGKPVGQLNLGEVEVMDAGLEDLADALPEPGSEPKGEQGDHGPDDSGLAQGDEQQQNKE